MLKLKLLMRRADSFERPWYWERLRAGGEGEQHRMRWLDGIIHSMDRGLGRLRQLVIDREVWRAGVHGVTKSCTWLSNWTELNWMINENIILSKPYFNKKYRIKLYFYNWNVIIIKMLPFLYGQARILMLLWCYELKSVYLFITEFVKAFQSLQILEIVYL